MANDDQSIGEQLKKASGQDSETRAKSGMKAFGQRMEQQGQEMLRASQEASERGSSRSEDRGLESRQVAQPSTSRRGGKVKRGGLARVHAGERVLTKAQAKRLRRKPRMKTGRL